MKLLVAYGSGLNLKMQICKSCLCQTHYRQAGMMRERRKLSEQGTSPFHFGHQKQELEN